MLIAVYKIFPKSGFSMVLELVTEKIYEFFEEIMGEKEKKGIKTYVVVLFFIILISNLLGLLIDFAKLPLPQLEEWFSIPTSNINFTAALSSIAVIIMLIVQHKSLWGLFKQLNEYVPIRWKNILTVERGKLPLLVYYPLKILVKAFDIGISLFIGLLDIVGLFAKVLSLAARLAWNMTSGPILLAMLVWGLVSASQNLFNIDLPIVATLIVYIQGLLVALIQAFVFPLLVGIFIKMAQGEEE